MNISKLLVGTFALVLISGISSTQAFAETGFGTDEAIPENAIIPSVVVPTPVDCGVDSNVVAWVTNNGGTVGDYLTIADDIETNLGVTARNVFLDGPVPECIEKLVVQHAPGGCLGDLGPVADAAILDWVNNDAGELLILEEWGVGCGGGSADLTLAFGATWEGNQATTCGFPGENYDATEFDAAHPIMAGVTSFNMQCGTDFTSDGTLDTIVTDSTNDRPVMLAGPVNNGCVVITGDSNWMADLSGAIALNDARIVANNVFDYLNNVCNDVVAGELLPIDNTALFLAGLSSSAVWIIPTLAGLAGAGVIIRQKLHRD